MAYELELTLLVIFIILLVYPLYQSLHIVSKGGLQPTQGKIIDVDGKRQVEYMVRDKKYTKAFSVFPGVTRDPSGNVGDTIDVYYIRDDPETIYQHSYAAIILGVVGGVIGSIVIGLLIHFIYRQRNKVMPTE